MTLYKVRCSDCDDQHELTTEEYDILDDDKFICDACFHNPPDPECRCQTLYGMRKSFSGPGYFHDSNPGVYVDNSACTIHS